ncbi:Hypothetical_protein [Hexamita inflata]|uniref:Hypothetical_protein n=1 Tax=Hexamita inflata TaxID=28002 RepID=A0AA86TTC1_9EUKA|nr:Hypothetical protein HINF_LOCUS15270 [Hexamita inflata]
MERLPLSNPEGSLMACPQPYRSLTVVSTLNRGILPSATDLVEPHLRKSDAARNEKRNRMNPSSITLNKAGIPAMPLQLQRWPPSLIVRQIYLFIFIIVALTRENYQKFGVFSNLHVECLLLFLVSKICNTNQSSTQTALVLDKQKHNSNIDSSVSIYFNACQKHLRV